MFSRLARFRRPTVPAELRLICQKVDVDRVYYTPGFLHDGLLRYRPACPDRGAQLAATIFSQLPHCELRFGPVPAESSTYFQRVVGSGRDKPDGGPSSTTVNGSRKLLLRTGASPAEAILRDASRRNVKPLTTQT